ncbi:hypothetical protein FOPG_19219 [Fusarium oxysporum f. sp. conglutinans race 2 54008]|uniref:Uncharacterized protein n=1 Tax=Fusarium oxysporum f. sp. conglutinans race 2 54008 TaxID=1089457 RepID=X0HTK8_FUSOX|nr:hypothetical protein FOPG_19219 [Fusarium oxysporum f. sp. conglutinans race 2 54008]
MFVLQKALWIALLPVYKVKSEVERAYTLYN